MRLTEPKDFYSVSRMFKAPVQTTYTNEDSANPGQVLVMCSHPLAGNLLQPASTLAMPSRWKASGHFRLHLLEADHLLNALCDFRR